MSEKKKKGRPFAVKNDREKLSLTLTLAEGCMEALYKRYDTTQNSTAIRKGLHELLGINEDVAVKVDTNSSRENRKQLAKKLKTTVSKINECMEENKCTLEEVSSFF